jgi:hypothetical protein
MTQDEIIRMAREANLICESRPVTAWMESTDLTPYLTRFAALVRAEREWVDLTDDEINQLEEEGVFFESCKVICRAVIEKFKEKQL